MPYLPYLGQDIKALDKEGNYALAKRLRDGDLQAREEMIVGNVPLALNYVKRQCGRYRAFCSEEDLAGYAIEGLIQAVDKYDPDKGGFSNYATWWMRQAVQRGVRRDADHVRLPSHVHEDLAKIRRIEDEVKQRLARDPTLEELASGSGLKQSRLAAALQGRGLMQVDSYDQLVEARVLA